MRECASQDIYGELNEKWQDEEGKPIQLVHTNCGAIAFKQLYTKDFVQMKKQEIKRLICAESKEEEEKEKRIKALIIANTHIEDEIKQSKEDIPFFSGVGLLLGAYGTNKEKNCVHTAQGEEEEKSPFELFFEEHEDTPLIQKELKGSTVNYAYQLRRLYTNIITKWTMHKEQQQEQEKEKEQLALLLQLNAASNALSHTKTRVIEVTKDAMTQKMRQAVVGREPQGDFDGVYYSVFTEAHECLGFARGPALSYYSTNMSDVLSFVCCISIHNVSSIVHTHLLSLASTADRQY